MITPDQVIPLFPNSAAPAILRNLDLVLEALAERDILDLASFALGTIAAEVQGFEPISERPSRYNTAPWDYVRNQPMGGAKLFGKYDRRFGNLLPGDGFRYHGRGFVQLTFRANYREIGEPVGIDLEVDPERANEPRVAAKVLAAFLWRKRGALRKAMRARDLRQARRLVNGGLHGFGRFEPVTLRLIDLQEAR